MNPVPATFRCRQCGNCCATRGVVQITEEEAVAIAAHLGLDVYDFTERYTRLDATRSRLLLVDRPDGACIFLSDERRCLVHDVKPAQCRNFPFTWRDDDMLSRCAGME